jgi:ketosteroid isomerase-like protein
MSSMSPLGIAETFIRDGIGKADPAVFDALLSPDIVVETGLSPQEPIRGRDAYKAVFFGFAEAWPVRDFVVHRIDAAGDTVFVEFTATAEFARDYYGVPATHQLVPMREIHRLDIEAGRIVRNTVAAVNLPFEFIMYPALKDAVLGSLRPASTAF